MQKVLILATKNKGKVKEIKHVLRPLGLKILSLIDHLEIPDIKETAVTFEGNSIKKARTIAKICKCPVLADDSGLEVYALGGRPGVRSARYAGPDPTTKKLCKKLLKAMRNKKNRLARFVCVIAIALHGELKLIRGVCSGNIALEMKGKQGFGYDPVFIPDGYTRTFAQMPLSLKNRISHRAKALQKAKAYLATFLAS